MVDAKQGMFALEYFYICKNENGSRTILLAYFGSVKKLKTIMKRLFLAISLLCMMSVKAASNDFKIKGFHVDLRVQVMTVDALKKLASELSTMGINTIVMEWEASFPYEKHAIISNKYAYTQQEVRDFVSHCNALGIDVIPLQQCFGHVEYILRHERYTPLREQARNDLSQICPLNHASAELFGELFAEVDALNTSQYIHIGGDETYLLGFCPKCQEYAEKEGKSKLFVQYIKKMCDYVEALGKRPVIWADIITKYPEAVDELPKSAILVDWNYGWKVRHFGNIDKVYDAGIEMWGAPALRSGPDNYYSTSWQYHFNNQRDFIPYARKAGYKGIVMTSWSTSGVYGYTLGMNVEVEDMEQIRNLYPMSGFRILIASYAAALQSDEPIDPALFTQKYAIERFRLSAAQGDELYKILSAEQPQLKCGVDAKGNDALKQQQINDDLRTRLAALKPVTNKTEFEHFRLMFDIRATYLEYKVLEAETQSPDFRREQAPELLKRLSKILAQSKVDEGRYAKLNKGYISSEEIKHQNFVRVRKMEVVRDRLRNLSRK